MLRQCLRALVTIALTLAAASLPAEGDTEARDYGRNVSFRVGKIDATTLSLDIENRNTDRPAPEVARERTRFWLALPPGARAVPQLEECDWETFDGEVVEGPFARMGKTSRGMTFPGNLCQLGISNIDTFRTVGMGRCEIGLTALAAAPTGGRQTTVTARRARFTIKLDGPGGDGTPEAALRERDPFMFRIADEVVTNPDMVAAFAREAGPWPDSERHARWRQLLADARTAGPVVLLKIPRPGVYRLTPADLRHAGVETEKLITSRMRFYLADQELSVMRGGRPDGPFVGEAAFFTFVVPDFSAKRTPYAPVWVMQQADTTAPREAKDIATISNPPDPGSVESRPTVDVQVFEPKVFDHRHPQTPETGRWATAVIGPNHNQVFEFEAPGLDPAAPAKLVVTLGAYLAFNEVQARVYVNDEEVGKMETFKGTGPFDQSYDIPRDLLRPGTNRLAVWYPELPKDTASAGLIYFYSHLSYTMRPGEIFANHEIHIEPFGGESQRLVLRRGREGPAPGELLVFDTTQPAHPVRLDVSTIATSGTIEVATAILPAKNRRTFIVAPGSSLQFPPEAWQLPDSDLFSPTEGTDELIVTHSTLMEASERFARYRETGECFTRVVDVEDAYALFGFGWKDYVAIQRLVRYGFENWPGRRLSRAILIGEASEYWWESQAKNDAVGRNLVPIFGWANPRIDVRGDEGYALVAGDGPIQDVEVGRFSVLTPGEVDDIARKIEDYETAPPAGPWMTRHLFVTDDEPEFSRVAEKIIGGELAGSDIPKRIYLQDYPYEDYFRIITRKRSTATTEAIVDAMSEGALTLTYFGHGGPNLWSAERIFHYRDISRIDNRGRQPIMAAASCDTAWVDYPVAPVQQSLGERELTSPRGGSIAVFAPISGTSSFEHDYLLSAFYRGLEHRRFNELGDLAFNAKLGYLLERNQPQVSGQFLLLGDPGLTIPFPDSSIGVQVQPSVVMASAGEKLSVSGKCRRMAWGMAEAILLDPRSREVGRTQRARVKGGAFELEWTLPEFLKPGDYRLVITAFNEAAGRCSTVSATIPVLEPSLDLTWETKPAIGGPIEAGTPLDVTLSLANTSAIPARKLLLDIRDAARDTSLTSTTLELAPGQTLTRAFPLKAPAGITLLQARVGYAGRADSHEPLAKGDLTIRALAPGLRDFDVPASQVQVVRAAAPYATTFEVPVYNLSSAEAPAKLATLKLMDDAQGQVIGKIARIPGIPAAGRAVLRFTQDANFPPARYPLKLILSDENEEGAKPEQEIKFIVKVGHGSDLEVVQGSVRTEEREYVQGHTVFLRAKVRNAGDEPAARVKVAGFEGLPWAAANQTTSTAGGDFVTFDSPLAPGEEREVRLRWDPKNAPAAETHLYVCVNSDRTIPETDFSNNVGETAVSFARLPNLALDLDAIKASQRLVRPGDVVRLEVPFRNDSDFDFPYPFALQLSATSPIAAEETLYRAYYDGLEPHQASLLQAAWEVGEFQNSLRVSLNDDRDFGEATAADNETILPFDYLFTPKLLAAPDGSLSFDKAMPYGRFQGLALSPARELTVTARPVSGSPEIRFKNEFVVGEALPAYGRTSESDADNSWNLVSPAGFICGSPYEKLPELTLRVPLPEDDHATLYDIYLDQLGNNVTDGKRANVFRVKLEDDDVWTKWTDQSRGRVFLRRIETRDDHLDISFDGAPNEPAWNSLFGLWAEPVGGMYTSPVVEWNDDLEPRLVARASTPGTTSMHPDCRYATGDRESPAWGEWQPVALDERWPAAPRGTAFFQWRVQLVGGVDEQPTVRDIRIATGPESDTVARRP